MNKSNFCKGTTLVELVVSFALIGMLLVSSFLLIGSGMRLFYRIRNNGYAIQVCDTLMTRICSQLEKALSRPDIASSSHGGISFEGADGKYITISSEDGRLVISSSLHDETVTRWTFDDSVYMDFYISELDFSPAGDGYGDDIFIVSLTVKNDEFIEFSTERYVRCIMLSEIYETSLMNIH